MAELSDIVKRLVQLRNEQGISQRELARRTGIAQPRIAEIEAGRVSPTIGRVEALAKGLGAQILVVGRAIRR
jgi:transcriptional regulator with XRE-family HTH domain